VGLREGHRSEVRREVVPQVVHPAGGQAFGRPR
jgi:hypothetical protein